MALEWWTLAASLLLGASLVVALWWRRYSTRFARLGLPYVPPVPLLGNMMDAALSRRSQHDIVVDLYNKFQPHPYGGIYGFAESMIMIRDPEIIRAITVRDFDHFTDHADFIESEKANPIQQRMLLILKGKEWHDMRTTLSPAFTSMKMKNMFVLMTEIGQQMVDYLWKETAVYKGLTEDDVAAQAVIFFFAGFDTVSTVLTFCSYLLAEHEDVQRRLQQEVDDVMKKSGGQPSYEQVMGCQYLDMVISETLRMYTPLSAVDRQCVRPYRLPPTDTCPGVELKPGDVIWIPVRAIHFDPKYYSEPERFDPERFNSEKKHLIKPMTYLPFGNGPRICIGQRFALMEMKVLLLYFLSRFSFQMISKTPVPLEIKPDSIFLAIKGGSWLGIRRRP